MTWPFRVVSTRKPIGDAHHTMDELYTYRMLYNAHAANEWARHGTYPVVKSRRHSDGTLPFGKDNMFIVVAELPDGQVANHYDVEHWDLFQVPEVDLPPEYDGHNAKMAADRLLDALNWQPTRRPNQTPARAMELLAGMYSETVFFPFVENENGDITGPGHQDRKLFALHVLEYDRLNGGDDWEEEVANDPGFVEDIVDHSWAVPQWLNADEFTLLLADEETEGAIPITHMWGYRS